MITITGEEDIVTKAVAQVQQIQQIQNEMANIKNQIVTRGVTPSTELQDSAW